MLIDRLVQEDGVPDAESFLVKHYIEKHVEGLLHLVRAHPLYSPPSCIRTISLLKAGPPEGIPRNTLCDNHGYKTSTR
jgi:hypothetical protein